jgi:hypothetical protein
VQAFSETPVVWPLRHTPAPRRLSLLLVGAILLAYLALVCFWQFLAYPHPETWFPPAAWLWQATDGLINYVLISNLSDQLILTIAILLGVCRFRPSELGLDVRKLPAAVGLTALVWAANQIVLVLVLALTKHPILLNPDWSARGWTWAAGRWLGQLFGNTPLEETVFRGFLLPQCLLLMLDRMPTASPRMQIAAALLLSQGLFALFHVFFNLHQPYSQWLLLAQFVMGLTFAGLYVRTGNLFLAMGVHALSNNPSPLIKDPFDDTGLGGGIIMFGTLLSVLFGPCAVGFGRRWVSPAEPGAAPDGGRDPGSS